jgi:hypothetical protein
MKHLKLKTQKYEKYLELSGENTMRIFFVAFFAEIFFAAYKECHRIKHPPGVIPRG